MWFVKAWSVHTMAVLQLCCLRKAAHVQQEMAPVHRDSKAYHTVQVKALFSTHIDLADILLTEQSMLAVTVGIGVAKRAMDAWQDDVEVQFMCCMVFTLLMQRSTIMHEVILIAAQCQRR